MIYKEPSYSKIYSTAYGDAAIITGAGVSVLFAHIVIDRDCCNGVEIEMNAGRHQC